MSKKFKSPLLLIEWVDSSRLSHGDWMDWAEIQPPQPHTCLSVGFVAQKNKLGVVLVPTVADVHHEANRHVFGGIMIPTGAIVSQKRLR